MAKQLVPNVAILRMRQRFAPVIGPSVEVENELYVRDQVFPWTTAHLINTATRVGNAWRDNMLPPVSNELSLIEVFANDLGADPGNEALVAYGSIGGQLGQMVSPALAVLARWVPSPGGEPSRAHIFLTGGREADIDGNLWADPFRIALQAGLNAVRAAMNVAPEAQVVVSRRKNKVLRPQGVSNTVDNVVLPTLTATQRDRRT